MKTDITISRAFHDYLVERSASDMSCLFDLHNVSWAIGGPTFYDVGGWYRKWLQSEHLEFVRQREVPHLVVKYRQ